MNNKKIKIILILSLTLIPATIATIVQPDFGLHDFLRGMLIGMCSTAAAVWLILLIVDVTKSDKSGGLVSVMKKNKIALLSFAISVLFIVIVAVFSIPGKSFLSFALFAVMCTSMVVSLVTAGMMKKLRICFNKIEE